MQSKVVKLNVGGHRYEVSKSLVSQHPKTMLAKIVSDKGQKNKAGELFIDRDGTIFGYVLSYLRDGKVALPRIVRKEALINELIHCGVEDIDEDAIDDDATGLKAGSNVNFIWEAVILHGVISECLTHFLSLKTPSICFSHIVKNVKFHDFYQTKRDSIKELYNLHFRKVGLELVDIKIKYSKKSELNLKNKKGNPLAAKFSENEDRVSYEMKMLVL